MLQRTPGVTRAPAAPHTILTSPHESMLSLRLVDGPHANLVTAEAKSIPTMIDYEETEHFLIFLSNVWEATRKIKNTNGLVQLDAQ
jgi:hypothetical protein